MWSCCAVLRRRGGGSCWRVVLSFFEWDVGRAHVVGIMVLGGVM